MSNGGGSWGTPLEKVLEIVGVHAVVLHTGQVLYWCFDKRAVGLLNSNEEEFNVLFRDPNLSSYQLWDPTTEAAVESAGAIGSNSFCGAQCTLPDGRIFVPGGQDAAGNVEIEEPKQWGQGTQWGAFFAAAVGGSDNGGLKRVNTYDPLTDTWTRWPDMPEGRYYPTCLLLDDGSAFVAGGLSNLLRWIISGSNWCQNDQFAIYMADELASAAAPRQFRSADQYPIIRLLPGSRRLFVHIETTTYLFDLDSASFIAGAEFMPPGVGMQTYPLQTGHVLLPQKEGDAPRILIVGGSSATGFDLDTQSEAPAVQNGFIFEYDNAEPTSSSWRVTRGQPIDARLLSDTVLLPDGTVFIVNGIVSGAAAGHSGPTVGTAEIFDPSTETFTLVAPPSSAHPRAYHATAVLLPDARVAIAGNTEAFNPGETPKSKDDVSIEIYSPPYLSQGPRPVLASPIPASVAYGATLSIDNSQETVIDQVMMMRPCAVTHTVDMDQLAILLVTAPGASPGTLDITIPSDRSLAPPGPYMLFFLAEGIPSVATWVFLGVPAPVPPVTPGEDCEQGGPYPAVTLGPFEGTGSATEVAEGDCTVDNVSGEFRLILESRHGAIKINNKIDQHAWVQLTACSTVEIGQKIDQWSQATITANRDITIGQGIDQHANATIKSVRGAISIGQSITEEAQVRLTAGTSISIGNELDQHSETWLTAGTSIDIGQKINQHSEAELTAGTTVHIGEKIDQHSTVKIVAGGDVVIDQKIDQHCNVEITSENGSITIGEEVTEHAEATLSAPNGTVTIGNAVNGGAHVRWHAQSFSCPNTGGGTVTEF